MVESNPNTAQHGNRFREIDMPILRRFHRLEKEEELRPRVPDLILAPTIVFTLALKVSVQSKLFWCP